MSDRQGYGGAHMLLAFLGGAATGAAVAMLVAPRSGRETREQLGGYVHSSKEKTKQLPGALRAAAGAARETFSEAVHHSEAAG